MQGGVWVEEDDMLGGWRAGDEKLFLAVAIGPTGAEDMVVVAVEWPLAFVGFFLAMLGFGFRRLAEFLGLGALAS